MTMGSTVARVYPKTPGPDVLASEPADCRTPSEL